MNLKMRGSLFLLLMTAFVIIAFLLDVDDNGAMARGGGGGRSSSSGSRSSSSGSWSSSSGSRISSSASRTSSRTKLMRGAAIGRGVYHSTKKQKLRRKYRTHSSSDDFDDWNEWRENDGMLCRNEKDCEWINSHLYCNSYELDFTPDRRWFGGDRGELVMIKGACECIWPRSFNKEDLECNVEQQMQNGSTTSSPSSNRGMGKI